MTAIDCHINGISVFCCPCYTRKIESANLQSQKTQPIGPGGPRSVGGGVMRELVHGEDSMDVGTEWAEGTRLLGLLF